MEPLTLIKFAVQAVALTTWALGWRALPRAMKPVLAYIALSAVVDTCAVVLREATGLNTVLYMVWVPLMIALLCFWLWRAIDRPWAGFAVGGVLLVYLALLAWELMSQDRQQLLFERSVLLGYASIGALCAVQLIRLTEVTDKPLWREPRFWTYFAFFGSMIPAIPCLGLINDIYSADAELASALFTIVDALFLFQLGTFIVAGVLVLREQRDQTTPA
ncbi:MAG: hypothetical protein IPJ85_00875 [Flavobacteriales bacterium]|nr:hypothetical protein [Flavobacteriales bacterium]